MTGNVSKMIRTQLAKQYLSFLFVSILLLLSIFTSELSHAISLDLEGRTIFDRVPSGVIRDIEVNGNVTYLAAENGVFEVTGAYSKKLSFNSEAEQTGIISDIQLQGNYLWIVEYGVGVFRFNLKKRSAKRLYAEHEWESEVWSIASTKGYTAFSIINDLILVNKSDKSITHISDLLVKRKISEAYSIQLIDERLWVAHKDGLIKISLETMEVSEYLLANHFPELTTATFIKEIDQKTYLGGKEGLYIISGNDFAGKFIKKSETTYSYIQDVYKSKSNEIWVSDGSLLKLDNDTLQPPDFLNPILDSESIRTVTKIVDGPQGSLLISSSQLGLITLTPAQRAVNFISLNSVALRDNIQVVTESYDGVFIKTESSQYRLDLDNGKLFETESRNDKCLNFRDESLYLFKTLKYSEICKSEYKHKVSVSEKSFYLYFDNGTYSKYLLIKDGEVLDSIDAPRYIVESRILSSGEIAAYDIYDNVYFQLSKFSWRKVASSEGRWYGIQCLEELPSQYLICTSGSGLKSIDKDTGAISIANEFGIEGLRFIRDVMLTSNGNLWLATNMGLYFWEKDKNLATKIDEYFGIFDSDFEYKAFTKIEGKILVRGDKYSYLIDQRLILKKIAASQKLTPQVILTSIEWSDSETNNEEFFPTDKRLKFNRNFKEAKFNFTSDSFFGAANQKLEIRLDSSENGWVTHNSPNLSISLSDLEYGEHIIEVRAITPFGKGEITKLSFFIDYPFWMSNTAITLYLIVFIIIAVTWKLGYLVSLLNAFKTTQIYTALTRYEITDGQSKFEKMLRSKDNFINELTHELSTPIQVIKGALEDVTDSPRENTKELISIKTNMRRVEQLIEQMRNGAPHAFDAEDYYKVYTLDAIRFIINSIEPLAKQKRQNLDVRIKGKHSISLINDSLEKILSNLLQNAIKYTPEHGNIKIAVAVDSKELKIVVSDDGEGIEEYLIKTIFERFKRGNTNETGEGIGLAIVKSLVELNQGTIEVESKKGVGSKFTVCLPIDDIEYINIQQEKREINERADQRKSILVVDDSREFRAYMFDLLSKKYRCLVAKNGEQALEVMQQFLVDLVVTDQIMPAMDGLTLVKEIRSHAKYAATPILMLSAKTDAQFEKSALTEKVDYILSKPTSKEDMLLRIEHLLTVRDTQSENVEYINKPEFEYGCLDIPTLNCEKDMSFYLNFIAVLEKNYQDENFNRDQAAAQLLMSTRSLNRRLSELFEYNFSEFLSRYRIERSIPHLLAGEPILETCLEVGFVNAAYFSTSFKKIKHIPPKKYAEQYSNAKLEAAK